MAAAVKHFLHCAGSVIYFFSHSPVLSQLRLCRNPPLWSSPGREASFKKKSHAETMYLLSLYTRKAARPSSTFCPAFPRPQRRKHVTPQFLHLKENVSLAGHDLLISAAYLVMKSLPRALSGCPPSVSSSASCGMAISPRPSITRSTSGKAS